MSIEQGDCIDLMAARGPASVDAIICDPPYGLAFMGKAWDHGVPGVPFWTEALRVAKPGAHLVAFGGTRTFHRLTCAIEDAGWEIRDCLSWLYGSGFPKSLDVSKAMDKAAGVQRKLTRPGVVKRDGYGGDWDTGSSGDRPRYDTPATTAARQWDGWGTALKPAWEPIILARKPLVGTVAANVAAHGTGALNVDGCRIAGPAWTFQQGLKTGRTGGVMGEPAARDGLDASHPSGRWPANVCLDEQAAAILGEPSRFFYCAKASRAEREEGLAGMPVRTKRILNGGIPSAVNSDPRGMSGGGDRQATNHHPTVKPVALMRWLCRLVTPPGGLILDPFMGSGTTGVAAALGGFRFMGMEKEAEYLAIAEKRIAAASAQPDLWSVA